MKIISGFKLRQVAGEWIISGEGADQVNFNKLLSLNDTAAYLWGVAQEGDFTVESLTESLLQRYDVAEDVALADVTAIVEEWRELKIVE